MAKWYYYEGDQVKGPVPYEAIRYALWKGEITSEIMVHGENDTDWTTLKNVIDAMKQAGKEVRKKEIPLNQESCNEFADNLLTASCIIFICMAIIQFMAGLVLWSKVSLEIGLPLIISVPGYIFPIAISYVLRQMFRHQLRS